MPGYELIDNKEFKQISDVFKKVKHCLEWDLISKGKAFFKVNEFEKFAKKVNSKYALAVTSGTAALRVALSTIDLKKGDEVITQLTFVATVEAIVESRGTPVCTEIDKTLNMDPKDLLKKLLIKQKQS